MLKLYQLVIANGCPISPFAWRSRYALAHKGVEAEIVPVHFGEIPAIAGGDYRTVPILRDGDHIVGDSFAIADYLDETRPEAPLFATPGERAAANFFDAWYFYAVLRRMFGLYVLDIHDQIRPEDQDYFRRSREARMNGATLESLTEGREDRVKTLRGALQPMRSTLAGQPWLGGAAPGYADYIAVSGFLWIAGVASLPPLAADDPLLDWLDRARDLFGGLGRDPRQKALT